MSILGRSGKDIDQDDVDATPSASSPAPDLDKSYPQAKIGKTIVVRGELSGEEDLVIEGKIEGKVDLENHHLVVEKEGKIEADVFANAVTIIGQMEGNLKAKERVLIQKSGSLTGDISAPRVVIEDGAKFKGSVDMNVETADEGPHLEIAKKRFDLPKPEIAEELPSAGELN